ARAQIRVLASRELGVKSCAKLDQRYHAARHPDPSTRRPGDARKKLQTGGLARAVRSDDAEARPGRVVEGHVSQRKDRRANPAPGGAVTVLLTAAHAIDRRRDEVADRSGPSGAIALRDAFEPDDGGTR